MEGQGRRAESLGVEGWDKRGQLLGTGLTKEMEGGIWLRFGSTLGRQWSEGKEEPSWGLRFAGVGGGGGLDISRTRRLSPLAD